MSDAYKPAGTYELVSFVISTLGAENPGVDFKNIIHTFTITESMLRGSVRGTAKVYDAVGVYYNLPIRGQEVAEITYKDFYGTERTEKYFIYAVTDIRQPKKSDDSMLEYVLHFVSYGKFWSDRYIIRRAIAEGSGSSRTYLTVSDQANVLFADYFVADGEGTDKELVVTETVGEQKLVIPALSPEDAMHFLTRRAFSGEDQMNMFRFYETRDKYHFVDIQDRLFESESEEIVSYFYASEAADNTPEGELRKMLTMISVQFGNYNTIEDMKNGGYYRKTVEVDMINRQLYSHPYEHLDRYQDFYYPDGEGVNIKPRLSDQFINDHTNYWQKTYVVKDYPDSDMSNASGLRPQPYYGDIYNNKGATAIHFNNTKLTVNVHGTNNNFPGNVIEVDIPKFKVNTEKDEELSGKYLIESINNIFYENTFMQEMTLIKGGLVGERDNMIDTSVRNGSSTDAQTTPSLSPVEAENRDIGSIV